MSVTIAPATTDAWNDTKKAYPRERCLHELVEAQVQRTPDAIAVTFESRSLTYRELDARADLLAAHLVGLGVGPGVLVGVEIERSLDMLVGILAILKAGGAYVPLDPEYPADRLAFMLADSKAPFLLTSTKMIGQLPVHEAQVVCVDGAWTLGPGAPASPGRRRPSPEDLAYVIYTSGSTGKPKGVQLRHRGVVSFMTSMRDAPGLGPDDRLLAITTLSFDIAGLELFLPLTVGARVVIAGRSVISDGAQLRALLEASEATVLQATPVTWRILVGAGWTGGKKLKALCGGEALTRELADQLLERSSSVWNLYGPTETTIWSSLAKVESGPGPISIGRPIANTRMYVVDDHGKPLPAGEAGELLIGGVGVALGYLGRPELTAEKFIADPSAEEPGARLYRTGDLARRRADGSFEHLGRLDFQVKIRGFRIELGEIEAALAAHPGIRETVVVAREDVPGHKRLVAYVIPGVLPAPAPGELRRFLARTLADHMIPSAFVTLEALPLTPNKKVDRRALPAPASSRPDCSREPLTPRDLLERQLASAWETALGISPIGIEDDLFLDLGADSLVAVDAAAAIQAELATEVPPEILLQHRTVAAQASYLRTAAPSLAQPRLATLCEGRSGPDLFLVHSAGADAFAYLPLVRRLGKEKTAVHVLQNPYRLSGEGMYASVEAMARDYVTVLQKHQPRGPYRLGGWSLGGSVAFEMANQLVAAGHEVAGLVLFDAYRPTRAQRVWPRVQRALSRWRYRFAHRFPWLGLRVPGVRAKLKAWGELPPLARFAKLLRTLAYIQADDAPILVELLFPGAFDRETLRGLSGDALWEHVYAGVKGESTETTDLTFGIPGATVASIRQRARVFGAEDRIELAYAPRWVYPNRMTLLNVRGSTTSGSAWAPFTSQPLEIHEFDIKPTVALPLAHTAMMQEENVALFAAAFESFLERTQVPRLPRVNVLGVGVHAIDMAQAVATVERWILNREHHYVCVTGVHGVMECQSHPDLKRVYNEAGLVTPDGMPMVWLGRLNGASQIRRVYGPDLMLALCSLSRGYRHFIFGGEASVPELLAKKLREKFPAIEIVGTLSPPFRKLSEAEDQEIVDTINRARPDLVWVGLGCPKQERWMADHVARLDAAALLGVGAAFDFHAGLKGQAPRFMQRGGLEWLYRLLCEPRRLWRRYLLLNPVFIWRAVLQLMRLRRYELPDPAPRERESPSK
jgi:exopolysaccharide biosynthesis WecB/TagA/CpsF family protein